MTMKWEVLGERKFIESIDTVIGLINEVTKDAVGRSALLVEANSKTSFGPAHKKGSRKLVQDRPQVVSGNLMRSIGVRSLSQTGEYSFEARVGPNMNYARRIELGFKGHVSGSIVKAHARHTQNGTVYVRSYLRKGYNVNQSAYPYMQPGVKKSLPEMERIFISAWTRAIR